MRKKIIRSFLIAGIFITIIAVTFLIIYMSPWAKEKNERSEGWSESGFILKANEDDRAVFATEKKEDFFEFCINCTELDGTFTLKVYYLYNMTEDINNDGNGLTAGMRSDGLVIVQEEIERIGIYEYDFSDLKDGFYKFELSKMDNTTSATGSIRLTTYDSNWSRLMNRLGLK